MVRKKKGKPDVTDEPFYGGPTKRFFVSMLTRDIDLVDAILDLLDNSVDGAMRCLDGKLEEDRPFDGFWAKISLGPSHFEIIDNCGGIPWDVGKQHAFTLGRPDIQRDAHLPTIGMYGIGMKRAIFKIAEEARVITQTKTDAYSVAYTKDWLNPENDDDWHLPVHREDNPLETAGTKILASELKPHIGRQFGKDSTLLTDLESAIAKNFGYIIESGFSVAVNERKIVPRTLQVHSSTPLSATERSEIGIDPYVFSANYEGVKIDVVVGFRGPLPSESDIWDEQSGKRTSEDAGVSVICNDRVIVLNDKTRLTGWGDGTVAKYHNQFIAIAGLILFRSTHADRLPISTTKRGLEAGADVYLFARSRVMEGLKQFIDFTNKWKGMEEQTESLFESAPRRRARDNVGLATSFGGSVHKLKGAKRFAPKLPMPSEKNPLRRISFTKPLDEIQTVGEILFEDPNSQPSEVGKGSFDYVLKSKWRR